MKHDLAYYRAIQGMTGATSAKEAEIRAIKSEVLRDFSNSIDCEDVTINGKSSSLLITKTTDRTIKNVAAKPNESVYYGDIIRWLNDDWIVDVIDSDDRINIHGKMRRCNVILRWMDASGKIHAYPGFCEDATKYSEGVTSGKLTQTPDFQIKIKIHLDAHSAKIGRDMRFLLDASKYLQDMEAVGEHAGAFIVTRRNVLTGNHRGHGYVELTMVECAHSESDNDNLMIANYYPSTDTYTLQIANVSSSLHLDVGASFDLEVSATINGEPLDQTAISFIASNPSVATVSPTGSVKAITSGECVITAKAGNAKAELQVAVSEASEGAEIRIVPQDGTYTIPFGMSKRVDMTVVSAGDVVESKLDYSLVGAVGVASITQTGDDFVIITAANVDANISKTFTLRVIEPDMSLAQDVTFTIVGWF